MATSRQLTSVQGYPTSIFPQGFDVKFLCNICDQILRDPVQSFCGHRFCRTCVLSIIQSSEKAYCQTCVAEGNTDEEYSVINQEQIFPDNGVKRELSRVLATCVNPGCNWTDMFKKYEEHAKRCPMRLGKCPHCNEDTAVEQLPSHIQNECKSYKVKCPAGCEPHMDKYLFHSHLETNSGFHINYLIEKLGMLEQLINTTITSSVTEETINTINNIVSEIQNNIAALEQRVHAMYPDIQQQTAGQTQNSVQTLVQTCQQLELKTGTYEGIMTTLHRELERCITSIDIIERNRHTGQEKMVENDGKLKQLERTIALKDIAIAEHHLRLEILESTSYDGTLTWKIDDWKKKREAAVRGQVTSIASLVFYTNKYGYKMRVNLYPNGDGRARGTHLSVYLVLYKGQYDAILQWPFLPTVTFTLVEQNGGTNHISESFLPGPNNNAFKRPVNEMNEQFGLPLFVPLGSLNGSYVQDDAIFIKVHIDLSNLNSMINENPKT